MTAYGQQRTTRKGQINKERVGTWTLGNKTEEGNGGETRGGVQRVWFNM